ncbi:MAG: ATP-grasp domain-containing protein [Eubacteriales bacterium]|nr:ATP-grasp domain-containing protein [Eubacteriales bacterium]
MSENRKTVLVTAIGSFAAEAVIRSCKGQGFRVIGCDIYPAEWVANSLDTELFFQAPRASEPEAYRRFLMETCRRERVDYLLPLTDVEIDVLQQWRLERPEEYEGLGAVVCISEPEAIAACRSKVKAAALLEEYQACRTIPGKLLSVFLENPDMDFPLVVKPVDGRSSQGLRIVEDKGQLEAAAAECRGRENRFLVQERLEGRVVTADVVRSPETGSCVCLPRRELLRTLNGAGTSVQVFRSEELEAACRRAAEILKVRGCVNMEFIERWLPEGETEYWFLECNPRFAGGVAFSCMAGYDMVKNHLSCFAGGEPEPMRDIRDQYIARRYTEYRMG